MKLYLTVHPGIEIVRHGNHQCKIAITIGWFVSKLQEWSCVSLEIWHGAHLSSENTQSQWMILLPLRTSDFFFFLLIHISTSPGCSGVEMGFSGMSGYPIELVCISLTTYNDREFFIGLLDALSLPFGGPIIFSLPVYESTIIINHILKKRNWGSR